MNALAAALGQFAYEAITYLFTGGQTKPSSTDERIASALEELVRLKQAEKNQQRDVTGITSPEYCGSLQPRESIPYPCTERLGHDGPHSYGGVFWENEDVTS
jgi:hypothetical protein